MLFDILGTVLDNRGIKDAERFLKPSASDVIHYSNLKNIERAVELFIRHTGRNSTIVVLIDSDADGYCSGAMMVMYIRKNFPDVKVIYLLHERRENGLTKDMMEKLNKDLPDLLILPDSGTNNFEELSYLSSKGVDVIITDHHTAEGESECENVATINPQLCLDTYPNENLAAGGITYKFLQALDEHYGIRDADSYLDLVAISAIADSMTITEPETNFYVREGLKRFVNPFFKELAKKHAEWAKEIYPEIVSWNLVNRLNACIRVGDMHDKTTTFRALLGEVDTQTRISKYRGKEREVTETLQEQAVRLCENARNRQNNRKKKLIEEAEMKIAEERLDKNAFIILTLDEVPSGFSGLIAGSMTSLYYRPALVLSKEDGNDFYTGSLRGFEGHEVSEVKTFLESLELFELVAGHEGAAGLRISESNLKILNSTINSKLNFTHSEQMIPVDFEAHFRTVNEGLCRELDSIEKYFCKGFDSPLFAIKDVEIDCSDIQFKGTTKFLVNDVEYISFDINKELQSLAEEGKAVVCDVIGTIGINRYRGNECGQVKITAIDIKQVKDKPAFTFEF
ncbi:DHH family phosphoesterase [Lederbergia citrisecunda]|uniref:DHH family phosphoesterase n=1 Tax=Lederbergia citrisecunda TaxID=2833583 RepID=UPI003D2D5088